MFSTRLMPCSLQILQPLLHDKVERSTAFQSSNRPNIYLKYTCYQSYHFPLVLGYKIHLVHEAEYFGIRRVLEDGLQARLIIVQVLLDLPALHIKDVDQDLHVPEDIVTLTCEIILHESFLPVAKLNKVCMSPLTLFHERVWWVPVPIIPQHTRTHTHTMFVQYQHGSVSELINVPSTIPQVENQVAKETYMWMFHVN